MPVTGKLTDPRVRSDADGAVHPHGRSRSGRSRRRPLGGRARSRSRARAWLPAEQRRGVRSIAALPRPRSRGISVAHCAASGQVGTGHVTVTFSTTGRVSGVVVDDPSFSGTPAGRCVTASFFRAVGAAVRRRAGARRQELHDRRADRALSALRRRAAYSGCAASTIFATDSSASITRARSARGTLSSSPPKAEPRPYPRMLRRACRASVRRTSVWRPSSEPF